MKILVTVRERKQLARESLLADMEKHNLAITRIKTQLNTLVPISMLPPEMLACVFQIAVDTHRDHHHRISTTPPYAWIFLTHVCAHWRAVALATPTLWNEIVLPCRQQWVREMLARSQNVPLVVRHRLPTSFRRPADDLLRALQIALGALYRIRILTLYLPSETYRKIAELLLRPAPLLQHLGLYTSNILSCIGRAPPVLHIHSSTHPAIDTIDFSAYSVSWPALSTCHNVRYLSIDSLFAAQ